MQQRFSSLLRTLLLAAAADQCSAGVFPVKDIPLAPSILPDALAPSPAPALAPAGPTLKGCLVSFTIDNYDHKDLAKTICSNETNLHRESLANASKLAEKSIIEHAHAQQANTTNETANPLSEIMDEVGDAVGDFGESIGMKETGDAIQDGIDDLVNASDDVGFVLVQRHGRNNVQRLDPMAFAPAAAAGPAPAPGPQPVIVVCESVQTVLKRTIESTVQEMLALPSGPGPAPAPVKSQAPPPQLRGAAIPPALAPASAPPSAEVEVFIRFHPGDEKKNSTGQVAGRNVKVDITLFGLPGNMIHDMKVLNPSVALTAAAESGAFDEALGKALLDVTGVKPKLSPFKIEAKQIGQWSVDKCQAHFSKIVKHFSVAYTRGLVPHALYNECTNFMTRLTFSDDLVIDDLDRNACRQATLEFGKRWKFGARKSHELPLEGEFDGFCESACQFKYGRGHPACHVTEGKDLLHNP